MNCPYVENCGGCPLRTLSIDDYRKVKQSWFAQLLKAIKQNSISLGEPIFADDGLRRRAELTFVWHKKHLKLGFNTAESHEIVDIEQCKALEPSLNAILPAVRQFLQDLCSINISQRIKNKVVEKNITCGEIWLTKADNGIDILLEIEEAITLEHRFLISDFTQANTEVVRVSVGKKNGYAETIIEKVKPFIDIVGQRVFIGAGTFLQPSKAGEKALIATVMRYAGETQGRIADLFCGIGTFSYPLAKNMRNKITAIDSSTDLLNGFRQTVNASTIPNIEIVQKNLFKYPLDAEELRGFDLIVFDPPRAGASAQVKQLADMPYENKPYKVIAVSCNPHTFINDANTLIGGGYEIREMTLVDQFVYSKHFELVALFVKKESVNEFE